jgi:TolB protein
MDQEQPTPEPQPEATAAADAAESSPDAAEPSPDAASPPSRSRRRLRIAVALTLVAAIAVLAALQISGLVRLIGGPSSREHLPARIAIVDGAGLLTTMDDLGGSSLRHPVDGVGFQFPAWSPDGSRVAAIGNATDAGGIYIFQARGEGAADPLTATAPTVVYRSPDREPFYLYWTPDSRNVTFLTSEPEGLALRVAPADGNSAGAILRQGAPLYWDWVDPDRALVHVGGGTDAFLGEVGLDGAAGQPNATSPGLFRSPAVSRDGSHRAFMIDKGGGSESLVVESRDGSKRHELPVPGLAAFTFAPAGTSLAFIAPAARNTQPADLPIGPLRVVDVASGSVRTIQEGLLVAFFWSPDGRTIATLRIPAPGENDVASLGADLPASAFPPAATTPGYDLSLAFVDVATGEARSTKMARVSNLFGLQILPFFDQYALSHRFWSPDSTSIVLPVVNDQGVAGIVVFPADGSALRRLADGEMGFWSP